MELTTSPIQEICFPKKRHRTKSIPDAETGREKRMKLLVDQMERSNDIMERLMELKTRQFQFQQEQAAASHQHYPPHQNYPAANHYHHPAGYFSSGYTTTYSTSAPQQPYNTDDGASQQMFRTKIPDATLMI